MQFRVIVVTDRQTHKQDRLQYTAPQLEHSVKIVDVSEKARCYN